MFLDEVRHLFYVYATYGTIIGSSWMTVLFSNGLFRGAAIAGAFILIVCHWANSRFARSKWETALLCNDVSHSLGASLESALLSCGEVFATPIWRFDRWCIIFNMGHQGRYPVVTSGWPVQLSYAQLLWSRRTFIGSISDHDFWQKKELRTMQPKGRGRFPLKLTGVRLVLRWQILAFVVVLCGED